jgi:hypothetical protein
VRLVVLAAELVCMLTATCSKRASKRIIMYSALSDSFTRALIDLALHWGRSTMIAELI